LRPGPAWRAGKELRRRQLGSLLCVENDSELAEVGGYPVDDDPEPGAAFLYLVRYATRIGDRSYGGSSVRYDRRT
jgi:hypothetical protein